MSAGSEETRAGGSGPAVPPRGLDTPTLPPDPSRLASPNDDDLGMVLSPEHEEASQAAQRGSSQSTISWPGRRPVAVRAPADPGATDFGNYWLYEEIGRGGMGVVFKARQKGLDRLVAVKMILGSHLAGAEQVERFYDEARAAARLRDPNIVAIHEVGHIAGQHFFAMEFVDGPSLAEKLRGGPIEPSEASRLLAIVARAVGRLHARGMIHRDLKPSNILLDASGRPLVTDFGVAKLYEGQRSQTRTGAIVGTPSYMAPEQAAARSAEVGPRSDIYSLGAILYELLVGQPPFDEEHPLDTLVLVLEREPTRPSRLRPGVPRALELICLKCLEKQPEDRYASADALADDLERFLAGDMVEARKLGAWTRLRRWTRREPALVSRLSTLALCASMLQADRLVREESDLFPIRPIMLLLGLGAAASLTFQTLLKRERWSSLARYTWATADVTLFTSLVITSGGLSTSLVAGFFLLVTASGLWFREVLVWYTTALAVVAYGAVVGVETWQRKAAPSPPLLHALFMMMLAMSGLIIGYQVRRVRSLGRPDEPRRPP